MSEFDEKVDSVATVLEELPPMVVMKAIEQLAEDDESPFSTHDLVTAAGNVADKDHMIKAANLGEGSEVGQP